MKVNDPWKFRFLVLAGFVFCALTFFLAYHTLTAQSTSAEDDMAGKGAYFFTAPCIPEQLSFAGEEIPLEVYWVKESLDRELIAVCNQHTLTMLSMKRSGRYFPMIEQILKEEGLPDDFKYLCVAESNLQNVVSPAKAAGFWQFMEKTAKLYGLEVREEVDERYNLEKATHAACKYLKGSRARLGSWSLAAAAYNMGEAGVKRNMTDQDRDNYWDLYLNSETARYMYRILAYKLVFENPERYHFKLFPQDYYAPIPCDTVRVDTTITSFYDFAASQNVTYKEFKELNPWLRAKKLTVSGKDYTIKIPKNS